MSGRLVLAAADPGPVRGAALPAVLPRGAA
jgi:hypothetical protein